MEKGIQFSAVEQERQQDGSQTDGRAIACDDVVAVLVDALLDLWLAERTRCLNSEGEGGGTFSETP